MRERDIQTETDRDRQTDRDTITNITIAMEFVSLLLGLGFMVEM